MARAHVAPARSRPAVSPWWRRDDATSPAARHAAEQSDRPQPDLPPYRPPLDPRGPRRPLRGSQPPRGAAAQRGDEAAPERPIALLATAIPSAATLSVADPPRSRPTEAPRVKLAEELLATAETNAADALHRCHRALELDGHAHGYTADEWLPVVYDAAAPLLESSQLDQEPPSVVRQTQEAVRWLASSIARLDEDSRETTAALADTIACLLVVCVFVDAAMSSDSGGE